MPLIWIGFIALVLAFLALDLGVFHRKAHVIKIKEALLWTAFWIAMGLAFGIFVYYGYENHWMGLGSHVDVVDNKTNDGWLALVKYLTGYVVEKSLSVDNIFVIAMIFGFFKVPAIYQHRVLFWGILGALVMRGVMIWLGTELIRQYDWILYVFGGFLIITGLRMMFSKDEEVDPDNNYVVKAVRKMFPVSERYHGQHFFVRAGSTASHEAASPGQEVQPDRVVDSAKVGTLLATPMLLALVMVEVTDVIFAVDSIPAIFAITADPFLVFTSNVFAILGLRSLYFALAGMMDRFRYLKLSLAIVLMVVGGKMLAHDWLKEQLGEHFNLYLLAVVLGIIAFGVLASLMVTRRETVPDNPMTDAVQEEQ